MSLHSFKRFPAPVFSLGLLCASYFTLTGLPACGNAKAALNDSVKSAFKYREIFLPEGIGDNATQLGLNTLEFDWGIWGHNLGKVLPEDPSQSVYAKVDGNTLKKQFCFSSNTLFGYIEDYIVDNFGEVETTRFTIIPNDNDIVCLCEKCIIAGNTPRDASPAATKLVKRLAERFPNHIFYTSDYKTTRGLPTDSMPSNSGVLISAIDFPLSYQSSPEETRFYKRIQDWNLTTPRILIWDYINNFDDYFTPFPALGAMQRRLKNYRDNKVTAVFLNGSGYDISAMSRLRTETLAAITSDPDIDWKTFLMERAKTLYPTVGTTIANFMLSQEEELEKSGANLPLYEGVDKARTTYLNEERFINFHDSLINLKDKLDPTEKEDIEILLGELALTRLELNRINGNLKESPRYLEDLKNLSLKGYPSYNEAGWSIDDYIQDYNFILKQYNESASKNKLKGERLMAMTPLDPDYSDISILTDGILGIPSNYHNGNLIISPASVTQIAVPPKEGVKKLKVWLSYNPAYRISLPETVTFTIGDREIASKAPQYPADSSGHSVVEFEVPTNEKDTLMLNFYKPEGAKSMAIEEIEGF